MSHFDCYFGPISSQKKEEEEEEEEELEEDDEVKEKFHNQKQQQRPPKRGTGRLHSFVNLVNEENLVKDRHVKRTVYGSAGRH